jgi:hypothetical protein
MMKNTLLAILLIFILGNLCHLGLPWWSLAFIAAGIGWTISQSAWAAFFAGLTGGFLLWYSNAWYVDSANGGLLSAKVGQLFMGVQGGQLMLASGLLGALLGAFGALTGRWAKEIFVSPKGKRRNYLQERRR